MKKIYYTLGLIFIASSAYGAASSTSHQKTTSTVTGKKISVVSNEKKIILLSHQLSFYAQEIERYFIQQATVNAELQKLSHDADQIALAQLSNPHDAHVATQLQEAEQAINEKSAVMIELMFETTIIEEEYQTAAKKLKEHQKNRPSLGTINDIVKATERAKMELMTQNITHKKLEQFYREKLAKIKQERLAEFEEE
ncbi:hypothetical protein K2W90_03225 [Candidatus Babeliales bacterium]|nr:hypothetical protein [Candidatus Babeliales bacterium]